jgi:hypothetical protein
MDEPHDGRLDGVVRADRLDAEPNADVGYIAGPDGCVGVESVTERELP